MIVSGKRPETSFFFRANVPIMEASLSRSVVNLHTATPVVRSINSRRETRSENEVFDPSMELGENHIALVELATIMSKYEQKGRKELTKI